MMREDGQMDEQSQLQMKQGSQGGCQTQPQSRLNFIICILAVLAVIKRKTVKLSCK